MSRVAPPRWLQYTLRILLSARDRETVAGDLEEEFRAVKAPQLGAFGASLWYARQVVSFAPRRLAGAFVQPRLLRWLCLFTGLAGTWLGWMDLLLKHPGYVRREGIAAIILCQALGTVLVLGVRTMLFLRPLALVGCLAIAWLAGSALLATLRGAHPEGYILLIALALLLQALLTLGTFAARAPSTRLEA